MVASIALAAVGLTLVFAFAAGQLFRLHRIPDIPLLLALGGVLGPLLGIVDVQATAQAMPFLAALALVMVLFDGALEVTPRALRSHGRAGLAMAGAAFVLTTAVCGATGWWAGLPIHVALLLGMCFGGAGIVIIIPMARRLDVSPSGMAVLLMEAVISDILVIVVISSSATVLLAGALHAGVALTFVRTLAVAGIIGAATGWIWGRFITQGSMQNTYGVTLAILLLVYAATEALAGSGPLAVLLFGLLVGRAMRQAQTTVQTQHLLGVQLIDFHQEAMFFVRAFLFVGLGVITRWDLLAQPMFLGIGLLFTLGVAASRAGAVALTLRGMTGWDRTAIALLFPRGLVTAAAALLPQAAGVPGTQVLDEYAAVVIVLTNIVAALAVFAAVRMRPSSAA